MPLLKPISRSYTVFGTVIVPPAADFEGSMVETSHETATTILPPSFGVLFGSAKLNAYGRLGSLFGSLVAVAAAVPEPAAAVAVGSAASSPPQPIKAAAAIPATASEPPRSTVRRLSSS